MNRMLSLVAALAVAGALTIGCGSDDDSAEPTPDGGAGGGLGLIMPSAPISIADATADDAPEGPVLVRGYLIEADGEVRLCDSLAESSPPQCGGDSLVVENFDEVYFERALSEGDVTWLGEPVEILGTVDGDKFDIRNDILQ